MKILFLQKRLLFPHNTGGKIRTLNVLRHLAKWHDVTYVCNLLEEEKPFLSKMESLGIVLKTVEWVEPPRRSIQFVAFALKNLFSPYPLNVDKDYDARLRALVEQEVASGGYDLLICDFVQMARNCMGIELPKLLFQHNVEAEIFERLAKRSRGIFRFYLNMQASRMREFESAAGKDFDQFVAVSDRDKQIFEENNGWENVGPIDTAVDTDYFCVSEPAPPREGVVFVGSMDWPPNVDGMLHFIANIWPRVRSADSDAQLTIVGRNPPAGLLEFDGQHGITVTGTVDDIRPFLASAAVAIVPLYSGGGTRLKIFEYMAMKCPVVSTALGAEGLDIQDNETVLSRDKDDEFADAVVELLKNPAKRQAISNAAFELVAARFSSEPVARQFEQYCEQAVTNWNAARS